MNTTESKLEQAYHANTGRLVPGIAHELNNPIGFVGSNLESLGKYIEEIQTFIISYESQLTATTKETFQSAVQKADLEFILQDIKELSDESLTGVMKLKEIVSNVQTHSLSTSNGSSRLSPDSILKREIDFLHNELKYSVTVEYVGNETLETNANERELSFVIQYLISKCFEEIEGYGSMVIKLQEDEADCVISINSTLQECNDCKPAKLLNKENKNLCHLITEKNKWQITHKNNEHELRINRA
ncbi:hypothetical protein MLD52_16200 [Puniceicoccaceae bacterium K14]|nr:hypothetical protein [Puniceicoccaceae bacterium K14]